MASRSWNRVELIGNLTRDPELRYTPNGAAVCTFGIATNRTYVTEGERREEVDFHRLVAWNKLAELCKQLLRKGHRVFISGRLQTRSWEGQDGEKRNVTEIVIEDMILLTPKTNGEPFVATEDISIEPDIVKQSKAEETSSSEEKVVVDDSAVKSKSKEVATSESVQNTKAPQEEVEDDLPF